jgi:hypothetical protein
MATLVPHDKRLVLRYQSGGSFSFAKVRLTATDAEVLSLGQAFASLQSEQPNRIASVVTQRFQI